MALPRSLLKLPRQGPATLPRIAPTTLPRSSQALVLAHRSISSRATLLSLSQQHAIRASGLRSYWWSSKPAPPSPPPPSASTSTPSPPPVTPEPPPVEPTSPLPPQELYKPEAAVADASPVSEAVAAVPPVDASITDLVTTPLATGDHIGDLAALGLGGWSPAGMVQTLLEQIHVTTGLPWWASIITFAAMVRIASLPIHIRVTSNNSKMAYAAPKVKKISEDLQKAKDNKDNAALMRAGLQMRQAYKEVDAHPLVGLLGFVQMPIALSMFFGIKWMCNLPVESMKYGGLSWFADLTVADPTYILPVLSTAAIVSMIKLSSADTPKTPETAHMGNVFTILSVFSVPIVAQLPAGVMVYFIGNGTLQAIQAAVFRIPAVRAWTDIRPPPSRDNEVPSPSLIDTLKAGYRKLVNFNQEGFDKIKHDAYARAERDVKRRQEALRREAKKKN
ncbi:Mitochondrial inner membrane protein oxa1 [Tulasnella sp. 403]|nr:Mitochondrial inner membrane protein oxa1 [Tulasnella sp. 403]